MRVFVYGTLKRGLSNHGWMAGQQFITEALTEPSYRLYDCGGYPGLVPVGSGGLSVQGEVWEVDEAGRAKLDILEDVAVGLYALEPVALLDSPEQGVMTYIYKWPVVGRRDVGQTWTE